MAATAKPSLCTAKRAPDVTTTAGRSVHESENRRMRGMAVRASAAKTGRPPTEAVFEAEPEDPPVLAELLTVLPNQELACAMSANLVVSTTANRVLPPTPPPGAAPAVLRQSARGRPGNLPVTAC